MKPARFAPLILLAWVAAVPAADEFYHNFRTAQFDASSFQLAGPGAEQVVEATPDGLRIKFLDGEKHEPTGVSLRFNVQGDFEITTAYAIKTLDLPTMGYGVGLGLYVETDSPTKEGITLERFVGPGAREVFASTRASMKDGTRTYASQRFPAEAIRSGQLRLSRRGSKISSWVAEGTANTFRRLQSVEVAAGDLFYVRLAGDTGGARSQLDATFLDLRIKTQDLLPDEPPISPLVEPAKVVGPTAEPPTPSLDPTPAPLPASASTQAQPWGMLGLGLGLGLGVLFTAGLMAYLRRRSVPIQSK